MSYNVQFVHPQDYKMILRDSYRPNTYYGLDEFDCKYLKIIQSKFGCLSSFHTIPDRVRMEMAPFEWNDIKQAFVLKENDRRPVQVNLLENMIIHHDHEYY